MATLVTLKMLVTRTAIMAVVRGLVTLSNIQNDEVTFLESRILLKNSPVNFSLSDYSRDGSKPPALKNISCLPMKDVFIKGY